jgi:hypothetical protein
MKHLAKRIIVVASFLTSAMSMGGTISLNTGFSPPSWINLTHNYLATPTKNGALASNSASFNSSGSGKSFTATLTIGSYAQDDRTATLTELSSAEVVWKLKYTPAIGESMPPPGTDKAVFVTYVFDTTGWTDAFVQNWAGGDYHSAASSATWYGCPGSAIDYTAHISYSLINSSVNLWDSHTISPAIHHEVGGYVNFSWNGSAWVGTASLLDMTWTHSTEARGTAFAYGSQAMHGNMSRTTVYTLKELP